MTTTLAPTGRRTGATWVAATGAFLLLAGAAVFVAVQWRYLPETAKVALVAALTAAFLMGGRALRRSLPATGDVLFHLGAFLLPIDLAGAGLDAGIGWRPLLLAEGILGVAVLGGLGMATGSVVLSWAGAASVMVLATGVAALTPLPATVVLASIAVGVHVVGRERSRRATAMWAAVAGLAPVIGAALSVVVHVGTGTLADLGLAGPDLTWAAVVAGALSAGVLAHQADRDDDLVLAYLSFASFGVGIVTCLLAATPPLAVFPIALGGAFAAIELVALVARRDPFWSAPIQLISEASEGLGALCAGVAGLLLLGAPLFDTANGVARQPELAAGLALAALGWLTADARRGAPSAQTTAGVWLTGPRPRTPAGAPSGLVRSLVRGGGWWPATAACVVTGLAAIEVGAASTVVTGTSLMVVAALLLLSRRADSYLLVAVLGPWALVTTAAHPVAGALVGLAAAVVLAEAGVRGVRDGRREHGVVLAILATGSALIAVAVSLPTTGGEGVVAAAITASWLLSLLLDRGSSLLGDHGRVALLVPAAAAFALDPPAAIAVLIAVTLLYGIDAIRLGRPLVGVGAAVVVQGAVAQVALASGLDGPHVGLALSVSAIVWCGLAAVVESEWRLPFVVAAVGGIGMGLRLAAGDPAVLSTDLLIAGSMAVGAGIATHRSKLAHVGGATITAGIAGHLALQNVTAPEPYVALVALQLIVVGWQARRHEQRVSSWIAYTPSVVLLGATALAERLTGDSSWHAVVAGAIGVVAVAIGGWRRLAGPMVAGTVLLVAVTVNECLSALVGVPTWAWLALGGSFLLAVGIALERSDTSPVEAGRRVVDVLAERYA